MRLFLILIVGVLFLSACYNPSEREGPERLLRTRTFVPKTREAPKDDFYYSTHRVVKGDTLNSLSRRYYGTLSQEYILLMKRANPEIRSSGPRPGQILLIPLPKSKTYTHYVKKGESLWKIAKLYYGKSTVKNIQLIIKHNPDIVGSLQVGQKLVIPPPDSE